MHKSEYRTSCLFRLVLLSTTAFIGWGCISSALQSTPAYDWRTDSAESIQGIVIIDEHRGTLNTKTIAKILNAAITASERVHSNKHNKEYAFSSLPPPAAECILQDSSGKKHVIQLLPPNMFWIMGEGFGVQELDRANYDDIVGDCNEIVLQSGERSANDNG